jgi:hypothetical protein
MDEIVGKIWFFLLCGFFLYMIVGIIYNDLKKRR